MDKRECIVDECSGCGRIVSVSFEPTGALVPVCSTYGYPRSWWNRRGGCPFLFKQEVKKEFKRTGQQKQKKNNTKGL